jgi:integrase
MPRVSKGPVYYPTKKGYFATIKGETRRLTDYVGPESNDELARAWEVYRRFVEVKSVEKEGDQAAVWAVFAEYLNRRSSPRRKLASGTLALDEKYVTSFVEWLRDNHPNLKWRDLTHDHFDRWLDYNSHSLPKSRPSGRPKGSWNDGGQHLALRTVRAACNWAVRKWGKVSHDPFGNGPEDKPPAPNYLGKKVAVTDEEYCALLAVALRRADKDFAALLMLFYGTGARLQEIYLAKAREWRHEGGDGGSFHIDPTEKGRGYKLARRGKERVVYVPPELVPVVEVQIRKYPEGPLFRTGKGKPFTPKILCRRFVSSIDAANRAAGRELVRPQVRGYSFRHAFVTRWLETRPDTAVLCELLDTTEAMLRKHYSHLFQRPQFLLGKLTQFGRERRAS